MKVEQLGTTIIEKDIHKNQFVKALNALSRVNNNTSLKLCRCSTIIEKCCVPIIYLLLSFS